MASLQVVFFWRTLVSWMCVTLVTTGDRFLFVFINTEVKLFLLQDCIGKVQSFLQSVRSPSKPRSPLSSSMLIQEGNECDAVNADSLKMKKGERYSQYENKFKLAHKCQNNNHLFRHFYCPLWPSHVAVVPCYWWSPDPCIHRRFLHMWMVAVFADPLSYDTT